MESNTEHTVALLEQNLPTSPPLDCPEKWDAWNTPEEYVLNISLTQPVTEKPFQTTEETDIYEDHNESEVTSYNPNNESLIPNNDVVRNEAEEEQIHHINENQGVVDSTPDLLEKSSLPNNEVEQTSENEIPKSSTGKSR